MPEAKPFELRIFCLCGQKMKVSRSMLGKPGKCIACRQKIRIPSEAELGHDEVVIHLKDHPEYLRRPKGAPVDVVASDEESSSDLERDDVILEGDSGQLAAISFEKFAPIRRLCNYEHKVKLQLQCIREGRPAELDKATLMSYRGLARRSRQQLEGAIREELIAIGAELNEVRTALTSQQDALKTGDTEYVAYSKAALPLRKRREILVYRQQNLRGWLATEDPHHAGGLEEVSLSDVPVDLVDGPFPLADEIEGLPIEHAVTGLEDALREREVADKLLNELHRMSLDGLIDVEELSRRRADTEAERQRTRTAVAYYRGRLEQVIQDCEEDSDALTAYEEAMRGQLAAAAIAQDVFKKLEEATFRAQVDVKRARNMANRALNANAVSDVPNPHGTFLERLARPGALRGLGADSWLAWLASILLLVKVFVPISLTGGGAAVAVINEYALLLFVFAALASLTATIVLRYVRGLLFSILWTILTIGGAVYINRVFGGPTTATGADLGAWWMSQGGILALSAWFVLGVASVVSLFPLGPARWVGLANVAVTSLVALTVLSNFFGVFQPVPEIGEPLITLNEQDGTYDVQIPILNGGYADFWIGGVAEGREHPAALLIEYKVGANSWANGGQPVAARVNGAEVTFRGDQGLLLGSKSRAVFHYALPPGIYRFQLVPGWPKSLALRHTFQLSPPTPSEIAPPIVPTDIPPAPVVSNEARLEVELKGVLDGRESGPIFSLLLRETDGTERKAQFHLGETLFGNWVISEFSPEHSTITVQNGKQLLVIERGQPEVLIQVETEEEADEGVSAN